jgi:hypothetical protein
MATNKRKEAAALFELIDKSTLKVPKQAGSLKIPAWWSSKSNPAAPAPSTPNPGTPTSSARAAVARQQAMEEETAAEIGPDDVEQGEPIETVEAVAEQVGHGGDAGHHDPQSRLFEPAELPQNGNSPSIRPPVPPSGSRFAPMPPANGENGHSHQNGNGHAAAHAPHGEQAVIQEEDLPLPDEAEAPAAKGYAGSGNGSRPFAPQTLHQANPNRDDWLAAQKFRLARAPMWVLVAGASGVVLVLVLIVWAVISLRPGKTAAPVANNAINQELLPPPQIQSNQNQNGLLPPRPNQQHAATSDNSRLRAVDPPPRPMPAQVFAAGTVSRLADLYYITVLTTPTESVAKRNADFIAANGVDISIEPRKNGTRTFYRLVSVKGFPTINDAGPLRKRIVDIGHLLPEYARTRRAWDDATVTKFTPDK